MLRRAVAEEQASLVGFEIFQHVKKELEKHGVIFRDKEGRRRAVREVLLSAGTPGIVERIMDSLVRCNFQAHPAQNTMGQYAKDLDNFSTNSPHGPGMSMWGGTSCQVFPILVQ